MAIWTLCMCVCAYGGGTEVHNEERNSSLLEQHTCDSCYEIMSQRVESCIGLTSCDVTISITFVYNHRLHSYIIYNIIMVSILVGGSPQHYLAVQLILASNVQSGSTEHTFEVTD